jgi:cysteinyl-tRNA synthetase
MWEMLKSTISDADKKATLDYFDQMLGLNLAGWAPKKTEIPAHILELLELRKVARQNKVWAESDRLRDAIKAEGFEVEDTAAGMIVKAVS